MQIEPSDKSYLAVSLMRLHLEINVRNRGGEAPPTDTSKEPLSKTLVVGSPWATLFKTMRLKLNGVVVSDSESFHAHVTQHLLLTKVPAYIRETMKETAMLYDDIAAIAPTTDSEGRRHVSLASRNWEDLNTRLELYDSGNKIPISLSFYVLSDISWGARTPLVIPAGVGLELEFHPNSPGRSIVKTLPDSYPMEPTIEISKAYLTIPRVTPIPTGIRRSLSHEFTRISTQALLIPQGSTLYIGCLNYAQTTLPARLTLRFINMAAFDGNFCFNYLNSNHMDVQSITYSVAGKTYPNHLVTADFANDHISEMMISTAESLRYSLENTGSTIGTRERYMNGAFLNSLDISPDLSADANWTSVAERGSITLTIRFAKPTNEQIIALVISETLSELKISNNGEVEVS